MPSLNSNISNNKVKLFSYTLYFLAFLCTLVALYNLYFASKILPGVYLNGEDYGGLAKEQAEAKIKNSLSKNRFLVIKVDGLQESKIPYNDISLEYDVNKTYKNLFKSGRENTLSHLYHLLGFVKPLSFNNLSYSLNDDLLSIQLASISANAFPNNQNAYFYIENDVLLIKDADFGKNIDLVNLKSLIEKGIPENKQEYVADTYDFNPNLFASDLTRVKPLVNQYLAEGLSLVYLDNYYPLNKQDMLNLISLIKEGDSVVINADLPSISVYLTNFSFTVNVDPKALVFEVAGESINFEPPITGIKLKIPETAEKVSSYITNYFKESKQDSNILVAYSTVNPDPNSNKYGITELLAEGVSYFKGSAANRVSNVVTATNKIKGTLVAPGETFSFNSAVGPIDAANGFNDAYVISKGRTVLGNGGGVCQVSTTVYRAALNSGMPIVERTAHAYRVGYYEQQAAIGLDATIYQPGVDLKFKNDTKYYLLVYSEIDTTKQKLTVKIYGTGDGRTVEISNTKQLSNLPPPEPIYEDTGDLPKGKIEQTEWPAWGGNVEYTRVVKDKDGKEMYNDTFKNYYKPWPAVYRRGV